MQYSPLRDKFQKNCKQDKAIYFGQDQLLSDDFALRKISKKDSSQKQNIFNEKENESFPNSLKECQNTKNAILKYKSPYHNLQKHTVTTIIQIVTIRKTKQDSLSEQAAYEMWRTFLKSNIKTKKALSVLYGKAEYSETVKNRFKKCGFQKILETYSQNTVINAQNILRQMTIQQMTDEKIRKNLWHRHVTNQDTLFGYIQQFLEELKSGPIKLRIDQKTSKRIGQIYHNQQSNSIGKENVQNEEK